jgi:hypothetical protein
MTPVTVRERLLIPDVAMSVAIGELAVIGAETIRVDRSAESYIHQLIRCSIAHIALGTEWV